MTKSNELPAYLSARVDNAVAKLNKARNSYEMAETRHEVEVIRDKVARYAANEVAMAVFKAANPQLIKQFLGSN
jgi:hypothetical protein